MTAPEHVDTWAAGPLRWPVWITAGAAMLAGGALAGFVLVDLWAVLGMALGGKPAERGELWLLMLAPAGLLSLFWLFVVRGNAATYGPERMRIATGRVFAVWCVLAAAAFVAFCVDYRVIRAADQDRAGSTLATYATDIVFHLLSAAAAAAMLRIIVAATRTQRARAKAPVRAASDWKPFQPSTGCLLGGLVLSVVAIPVGIVAASVTMVLFSMEAAPLWAPPRYLLSAEEIPGTWRHGGETIVLSPDGAVRRSGTLDQRDPAAVETGTWRLSEDGRDVVMDFPGYTYSESIHADESRTADRLFRISSDSGYYADAFRRD
ncbi:hypothetical protein [Yinghuangia soli]|uniref:Uncharacterized protein n=1 Tax=Yinghuangia soli TaxID=2908204 RepID=A0AA41Q2Z3_9ACTN|nr:hypothetical protein [Yinghuangia soli]MCF2529464.1 hypothetical protein [Yinghuangia soli]